jgi:DUF218 domain
MRRFANGNAGQFRIAVPVAFSHLAHSFRRGWQRLGSWPSDFLWGGPLAGSGGPIRESQGNRGAQWCDAVAHHRSREALPRWLCVRNLAHAFRGARCDSASYGSSFYGEDYYNKLVLIHEGVPRQAIHVLEPPIVNTADEIKAAAAALTRANGEAVIIVTTKAHTRRVRLLWRMLAAGQGRAVVRAASRDPFDPRHWWRTTSGAQDVVREGLGLLNAWAGLPLHAAR